MSAACVTLSEVVMGIYSDSAIGTHVTTIQKQNSDSLSFQCHFQQLSKRSSNAKKTFERKAFYRK